MMRARRHGTAEYWWADAACRSHDPDLFFPVSAAGPAVRQAAQAKEICAGCGVSRQCLDFALSSRQPYGIWGGLTEQERYELQGRRAKELPTGRGQAGRPYQRDLAQ
jgi:WhiB family redox-sensing transcriptional regulator